MRLYSYIKGNYTVKISGGHIEKILNRAIGKRMYIRGVKKNGDTAVMSVSKDGFEILKELAEENGAELYILEYEGIDKTVGLMKKRWMFFSACVTAGVCVLVSSSFIWTIDVPEADYISKQEVVTALSDMGIKTGHIRHNIDYTAVSNALVTRFDNLIWANVELKGTRLVVSFVPRKHAPKLVPAEIPSDIIAKKDGYIMAITAENGEKNVKIGDTVIKGQVLISGLVPSVQVGTRRVHSLGSVKAVTWTEEEKTQKLYKYEKNFSGNSTKKSEIELPFLKIPLYFKKNIDFLNYDSIIKEKNILFLTYKEYTYNEYTLKKVPIAKEEAIKLAEDELKEKINSETENIKDIKTTVKPIDEETISVRVLAQCEEEIGEQRAIE